jgi:hypothetical protein
VTAARAKEAAEARSCWFFSTRRAGPPSAQKFARWQKSREFGAVLTVVLMGPMSRLHPQVLGFIDRPEATMQGNLKVFDQSILRWQERGQ